MVNNEHWHEELAPDQAPAFVEAIKAKGSRR